MQPKAKADIRFSVSVSVDEDSGNLLAVYFQIREGQVAKTRELRDGILTADYNASGRLLGIELLGPCEAVVLDQIRVEKKAKVFIRNTAPREFLRDGTNPTKPSGKSARKVAV